MVGKNTTKNMGPQAPQKNHVFSITTQKQEERMKIVNNAPPTQLMREVIRNRARVD